MLCPLVETPQLNRRATAADLSEAAVRRRVQKLLDRGVMRIVAVTEPLTGGPRRRATVGIRAEGDADPVAEAPAALDEVEYVAVSAGSYDLPAEIRLRGRRPPAGAGRQAHPRAARRALHGELRPPGAPQADPRLGEPAEKR